MKKIVIPTDFSENAFNALRYAAELFKYDKCDFFVLHAYADEVYANDITSEDVLKKNKKAVKKKSEEEIENLIEKVEQEFSNPKHHFKGSSAFGLLVDEVNDLVDRENADLIVTSTRGATNDRKLTFGSNTLQIIKYVQCPVLSIPADHNYNDPKRILFPTNYMLPYQRRELKLVGDLARAFCSQVDMLHVSRFATETYRQRDNRLFIEEQLYDVEIEFLREKKLEKTEAILKAIDEKNIDLLILVNSRHSYLENVLYHSTIDEIGLHPKVPFLVLQNFHRN